MIGISSPDLDKLERNKRKKVVVFEVMSPFRVRCRITRQLRSCVKPFFFHSQTVNPIPSKENIMFES